MVAHPVISHLAFNFISGCCIRSIVDFNPQQTTNPISKSKESQYFYPKCQACCGTDVCLEAKSGLEDLAFALTTACPTPWPDAAGQVSCCYVIFGQVVALSWWPAGGGGTSEALIPQASNQMLPPISEECVLVRALNQISQLSDFSPILLK